MKVILLTEVKNKGGEGDVVDVAPGFANNYLLPQGMAALATKGNLKQLEQRKHNIAAREENRIADANKMKAQLEAQADLDIDRRRVEIKNAIKSAGEHTVVVSLYRDIKANLALLVGDEATFAAPAEEAAEEAVEAEEATEEAAE